METEVTLMVQDASVERARRFAERRGMDLARLTEALYDSLDDEAEPQAETDNSWLDELDPELRKLHGAIKLPPELKDKDYKDIISDVLWEKYMSLK